MSAHSANKGDVRDFLQVVYFIHLSPSFSFIFNLCSTFLCIVSISGLTRIAVLMCCGALDSLQQQEPDLGRRSQSRGWPFARREPVSHGWGGEERAGQPFANWGRRGGFQERCYGQDAKNIGICFAPCLSITAVLQAWFLASLPFMGGITVWHIES